MSAGADQGEGVVVVDGVKEEPVGYDMQFTVVREVACELVVAVLFEPVGATLSGGLSHVRGGSFCSDSGAHGVTSKGTTLTCKMAKDGRLRWKK